MIMNGKGFEPRENNGVLYYEIAPWREKYPKVRAVFSSRIGGVSEGERATMNLSFKRADTKEQVEENYRRLCRAAGLNEEKLVLTRQVHEDTILTVDEAWTAFGAPDEAHPIDADGLMTDLAGVVLVKHFADCVPLFFYDPEHHAVAMTHAGWRGTALHIGTKTVRAMRERFGTDPKKLAAAIGPSIGPCCFEVDRPVRDAFAESYGVEKAGIADHENGKSHVDLWQANKNDLLDAGLTQDNITVAGICTSCHPAEFYSHRRDHGKTGTLAGLISLLD